MMENKEEKPNNELLTLTGKVLFVVGLAINIILISFGFWPSIFLVIFMLMGIGIIKFQHKSVDENASPFFRNLLASINWSLIQTSIITAFYTVICFFSILILIVIIGNTYFKERDTLNELKNVVIELEKYKNTHQKYPENLETLAGINPTRAYWVRDYWHQPYVYELSSNANNYSLKSKGADGKINTKDDIIGH